MSNLRPTIILAALTLFFPVSVFSQVEISGPQSGVLGAEIYLVSDTISVSIGESLMIEPGAVLMFQGNYPFVISGALFAEGTLGDSVIFASGIYPETWGGIRFDTSAVNGSVIDYSIIDGAASMWGGGITIEGCQVTVSNSRISGNASNLLGGGINVSGPSTIRDCNIYYNYSGYRGGGVYCTDGTLVENCDILGNYADVEGGGVYAVNSSLINNCIVRYNGSQNYGGGIACYDYSGVENSTVSNNGSSFGGGIYIGGDNSVQIYGTTLSYNTGNTGGGININPNADAYIFDSEVRYSTGHGIYYGAITGGYGSAVISRCIISNNEGFGGGMYLTGPDILIENCNITNNPGMISDGITFFDEGAGAVIRNSIFEGDNKPVIYFHSYENVSIEYCDFYTGSGALFGGTAPGELEELTGVNFNGDSCDVYRNIYLDTDFFSFWGSQAFRLRDYSPCIDAGDPEGNFDPDNTIADMGVYYFPHENAVEPGDELETVSDFRLYAPYPNPFNETTVISFELRDASFVTLEIFDITGRTVGANGRSPLQI